MESKKIFEASKALGTKQNIGE